jgi:kinesin family member 5
MFKPILLNCNFNFLYSVNSEPTFPQVYNLMERGGNERIIAQTNSNDISSRSHTVFIITLEQNDGDDEGSSKKTNATLFFLRYTE